jgi:hypothetical protein
MTFAGLSSEVWEAGQSTHAERSNLRLPLLGYQIELLSCDVCGIERLYASRCPSSTPAEKRLERACALLSRDSYPWYYGVVSRARQNRNRGWFVPESTRLRSRFDSDPIGDLEFLILGIHK